MTSNRTFGIEIEAFGITMQAARTALRNAGLDCEIEGYNHETRAHWKVVSDASVPDGFEVVSPVLEGERGAAQAKIAMDALRDAEARISRACGLHIHFGASDLTAAEIATVVRRYAKFEDEIDAWMAPSRRRPCGRSRVLASARSMPTKASRTFTSRNASAWLCPTAGAPSRWPTS